MKTKTHKLGLLSATIALALSGATTNVFAQEQQDSDNDDNNETIELIQITAQKRVQSLQDVPISVSVFNSTLIDQNDMKGAADYLQATPNVSFTEVGGQGPRGLNISIRGISDLQNAERVSASSAFGVYVDEFSIGTAARGTPNPPLYDVERVEVLRGPQGTYFGRNATGGAINVTTKKPSDEFYSQLDLGYASFDTATVGGIINLPVAENFFVRATMQNESSSGQIDNVSPLSDGGDSGFDNRFIRLAARWEINDSWLADLSLTDVQEYSDMENRVSVGIQGRFGSDLNDPLYTCGLPTDTDDKACRDTTGFTDLDDQVVNLRLNYTGEDISFTSITGRVKTSMNQLNDLDASGRPWVDRENDYTADSFSQEFRFQNTEDKAIDWTIGALVYDDELIANNRIIIKDFLGPWLADDYANENTIDLKREGWAVFADVNWEINDSLNITLGGRYSDDEESQVWSDVFAACARRAEGTALADGCELRPDQLVGALPVYDGFVTGGRVAQTEGTTAGNSGTDFSPRLAINWDVNEDWTTYAVYSQGYKAPGARANPDSGGANSSFYSKEKLTNIEVGVKAVLNNGRTYVNAALFSMTWDDFQATLRETFCREADGSLRPQVGNENCEFVPLDRIQNAEEASASGIEIGVDTLIGENWRLSAQYGYLDAKYESFANAILGGRVTDLSGQVLPNAPESTASLSANYDYQWKEANGYFRLEANFRDSVFNQSSLTDPLFGQPPFTPNSYWVTNFRAGLEWDNYRLTFNINNLLDEDDFVTSAAAGSAGVTIRPNPRTFGIKWTVWTN